MSCKQLLSELHDSQVYEDLYLQFQGRLNATCRGRAEVDHPAIGLVQPGTERLAEVSLSVFRATVFRKTTRG